MAEIIMRKIFLLLAGCISSFAYAGSVYKCETSTGLVYQSNPCPSGAKKLAAACVNSNDFYSHERGAVKFDGDSCEAKSQKRQAEIDAQNARVDAENVRKNAERKVMQARWEEAKAKEKLLPNPIVGMTMRQVESSSWNFPNKVNKTTTANGTSEQWVYNDQGYLYFTNGILTAIQER